MSLNLNSLVYDQDGNTICHLGGSCIPMTVRDLVNMLERQKKEDEEELND